jgi:hypothetical protein
VSFQHGENDETDHVNTRFRPCATFTIHAAHAPQAHVVCGYSHTLGDDAIMMYGMPNEAMLHDFFGNVQTDAAQP